MAGQLVEGQDLEVIKVLVDRSWAHLLGRRPDLGT